ncbi:MAG: ABC transporter permease [Planctomycetota bacterium]|nr:ABC transporter permease [Planctomycetota bacterium]
MAKPTHKRWDFGAQDMEKILAEATSHKGESLWQDAWRRLKRNRSAFWSMVFLALFGLMALIAPVLPLASPIALSLRTEATAPSWPWESPPPTTAETPKGAAITSDFGAVMDNGWRHRSVIGFEAKGGAVDEVVGALVELVEGVTDRSPMVDRRSSEGAGQSTLYYLAVPYSYSDPAHTDWEPTGLTGSAVLHRIGDDAAWVDLVLPEGGEDPSSFDSWAVQGQDLTASLMLRAQGDRLLRYNFALDRPFAGSFAGIRVNGHLAPAIGKASEWGPLGAPRPEPAPEEAEPTTEGVTPSVTPSDEASDETIAAIQQDSFKLFLASFGERALGAATAEEDGQIVREGKGKRKVLFERRTAELREERGVVHDDLERRMTTALETFVAPAGVEVDLLSVASENGYWDINAADRFLVTVRAKVFGLWQTGNWLGTDSKGRDILARIVWGSRTSIMVALVATLCSLLIGVTYGAFSGLMGGRIDNLMMRFVDILYSLPFIFVVIFLITILNEYKLELENRFGLDREIVFYLVIGAIYWLTMARVVRGQVLSLKNSEFIEAARVIGAGTPRILFAHLVPNVLSIVIVYLTLTIPAVMLFEAFLSFLGLGIEPPKVSWGTLAVDGTEAVNPLRIYWWLVLFPAAAMGSTLLALNVLGDGLRDALDPKLRGKD